MSDKFTTVSVDHEEREVVAVTINGDTGKVVNVHKVGIPRSTSEPAMVSNDKAAYVFDNE